MTKSKLRKNAVERLTSDLQMEKENKDRLVREWQKANNEVYGLQTQVAALIDDQTRLKAEVERLTFDPLTYLDDQGEWMPRHIHLAAVERLQAEVESVRQVAQDNKTETEATRIKNARLQAEVERLTKAGDELERVLTSRSGSYEAGNASHEWQSAKNYKPKA